MQGVVEVEFTVQHGIVASATALKKTSPILERAALENVHAWQFLPSTDGVWRTTFTFRLEDGEEEEMTNSRVEAQPPWRMTIIARAPKRPCNDCGSDIVGHPLIKPEARPSPDR